MADGDILAFVLTTLGESDGRLQNNGSSPARQRAPLTHPPRPNTADTAAAAVAFSHLLLLGWLAYRLHYRHQHEECDPVKRLRLLVGLGRAPSNTIRVSAIITMLRACGAAPYLFLTHLHLFVVVYFSSSGELVKLTTFPLIVLY